MRDAYNGPDRRESGAAREKIIAGVLSFAAVVVAAVGSSLAFLSDISARFAAVDSKLSSAQSDLEKLCKKVDLIETDIRQSISVDHALSERITRCEISKGK